MTTKIKIEKDGTKILLGKICPFRNPLVLPTKLGSIEIQNIPCTSTCSLFVSNVIGAGLHEISFYCGAKELKIVAEEETKKQSNFTYNDK
jgi:hypothetical protein